MGWVSLGNKLTGGALPTDTRALEISRLNLKTKSEHCCSVEVVFLSSKSGNMMSSRVLLPTSLKDFGFIFEVAMIELSKSKQIRCRVLKNLKVLKID
jgi:hypothetical protein